MKNLPKKPLRNDLTIIEINAMGERIKNWGKWGPDDEIGTLNYVTPECIKAARDTIRDGRVFSLALPFDKKGPQTGLYGSRFNPIHTMLATGTDAAAGVQDHDRGPTQLPTQLSCRYADDMVIMPLQCGTQWDGLGHCFNGDRMWNGYDARLVDVNGAKKNGIEKTANKMVGRGVLLDIPRAFGATYLEEGYGVSNADLDECARRQGVEIRRGDFVLVRTGHIEECLERQNWGGYAGGDAPGLMFETAEWIHRKEIAAIACDTWGCEVRPNESIEAWQPWHWIVIPMMGITMGEIFYMKDLADFCAESKRYEFFFTAPALPITGAVGSPINPIAVM